MQTDFAALSSMALGYFLGILWCFVSYGGFSPDHYELSCLDFYLLKN
jgi:hypothetical protein